MVECDFGHFKPVFWLFHPSQAFAGAQVGGDRDKKARFVQSAASQINLSKVHFISRGFICARVAVMTQPKMALDRASLLLGLSPKGDLQADRLARRIMTLFDRGLRDFDLIAAKAANAEIRTGPRVTSVQTELVQQILVPSASQPLIARDVHDFAMKTDIRIDPIEEPALDEMAKE
jgi:hypothetical protein